MCHFRFLPGWSWINSPHLCVVFKLGFTLCGGETFFMDSKLHSFSGPTANQFIFFHRVEMGVGQAVHPPITLNHHLSLLWYLQKVIWVLIIVLNLSQFKVLIIYQAIGMGWTLCGILNKYLKPITLLGQFDTLMETI